MAGKKSDLLRALRKLLSKRWKTTGTCVQRVLETADADPVHDLRVSTRRLQEVVELAGDVIDKPRTVNTLKALRQARRVCGEVRNADVLVELLADRVRGKGNEREVWGPLMAQVTEHREREAAAMHRALVRLDLPSLAERWQQALKSWPKRDPKIEKRVERDLVDHVKKRQTQFRRAHEIATRHEATTDEIHDMRIAGKRLRYALEVMAELKNGSAKEEITRLRRLQESLGRWNDLIMLAELIVGFTARRRFLRENPELGIRMLRAVRRVQGSQQTQLRRIMKIVPAVAEEPAPEAIRSDGAERAEGLVVSAR